MIWMCVVCSYYEYVAYGYIFYVRIAWQIFTTEPNCVYTVYIRVGYGWCGVACFYMPCISQHVQIIHVSLKSLPCYHLILLYHFAYYLSILHYNSISIEGRVINKEEKNCERMRMIDSLLLLAMLCGRWIYWIYACVNEGCGCLPAWLPARITRRNHTKNATVLLIFRISWMATVPQSV